MNRVKSLLFGLVVGFSSLLSAGQEIAVVTMAIGDAYQEIVRPAIENKQQYCALHDYRFFCFTERTDTSRHITWEKIPALRQILEDPSVQWVFWSDADALIMNKTIPLEDLVDDQYNLIISQDYNGINNGNFLIRNCEWSRAFLKQVDHRTDTLQHCFQEQEAMRRQIENHFYIKAFVKYVPQRLINSYPQEVQNTTNPEMIYQPGDFVVHFASVHDSLRLSQLIELYISNVSRIGYLGLSETSRG